MVQVLGLGKKKVLVLCEFSGTVRDAFLAKGHDAWSCDLLDTVSLPERHLKMDCFEALFLHQWDLIIMHPPCTALANSGNRWYGKGKPLYHKRLEAITWTVDLWQNAILVCQRVCMENPVNVLPIRPTQYIEPWFFGTGEQKKTGLWLHNLPRLRPTEIARGRKQKSFLMKRSNIRGYIRALTNRKTAEAMADQWGSL